jgi:hypothetical protein
MGCRQSKAAASTTQRAASTFKSKKKTTSRQAILEQTAAHSAAHAAKLQAKADAAAELAAKKLELTVDQSDRRRTQNIRMNLLVHEEYRRAINEVYDLSGGQQLGSVSAPHILAHAC